MNENHLTKSAIAFYAVDNSMDFGRDTFRSYDGREILEQLKKLPDEEKRNLYLDDLGLSELAYDYNDELLDGGWWCVIIR